MDFTVKIYGKLLNSLIEAGYKFQTFSEFLEFAEQKAIILRHDVDAKKMNSLRFAELQHAMGIKGSYYFRIVPQSYDEEVIMKIASLGHEIGYHYEDMDLISSRGGIPKIKLKEEDLFNDAIISFETNLEKLRKFYPVKTICMHGSPLSPFDNKALWKKYNYRDYGIIGEPYFDINFNEVLYLTDTGRRWDGEKMSVRDKVILSETRSHQWPSFHSTHDIIQMASSKKLPDRIMFTFHPQRWTNKPFPWIKELIFQSIKNQIKKLYITPT